jgi:predicted regulator of Ras-like GTPase activity (Roadblock/LC7/MglB family)
MMETTFSGTRSVTAIFDDAAKAERAVAWLLNIGIKEGQIRQAEEKAPEQARPAALAAAARPKRRGLFDSLVDLVFPDDEGDGSAKGKAGQGPRSVTVMDLDAATYGKVVSILNDEGKVKLDTRKADIAGASGIKGLIGACLVDSDSGTMLASEGGQNGESLDFNLVAALKSNTVKAKQHAVEQLGLNQRIEDILITLDKQVHLIRPLERNSSMFVYLALDKASSNLGMARIQLKSIEANMKL